MENLNKLKELIAEGNTEETLDELTTLSAAKNYEIQHNIINLRRRWSELNRARANNTITFETAQVEAGRINTDILNLLAELEGLRVAAPRTTTAPAPAASRPVPAKEPGSKKLLWIGLGAALILLLILVLANIGGEGEGTTPEFDPANPASEEMMQDPNVPVDDNQSQDFQEALPADEDPQAAGDQGHGQQQLQNAFDATPTDDQSIEEDTTAGQ